MLGINIETGLRRRAFDHLQHLPFRFSDNNTIGHLIGRVHPPLAWITAVIVPLILWLTTRRARTPSDERGGQAVAHRQRAGAATPLCVGCLAFAQHDVSAAPDRLDKRSVREVAGRTHPLRTRVVHYAEQDVWRKSLRHACVLCRTTSRTVMSSWIAVARRRLPME